MRCGGSGVLLTAGCVPACHIGLHTPPIAHRTQPSPQPSLHPALHPSPQPHLHDGLHQRGALRGRQQGGQRVAGGQQLGAVLGDGGASRVADVPCFCSAVQKCSGGVSQLALPGHWGPLRKQHQRRQTRSGCGCPAVPRTWAAPFHKVPAVQLLQQGAGAEAHQHHPRLGPAGRWQAAHVTGDSMQQAEVAGERLPAHPVTMQRGSRAYK